MAEVRVVNVPKRTWYKTETDEGKYHDRAQSPEKVSLDGCVRCLRVATTGNLTYCTVYREHVVAPNT